MGEILIPDAITITPSTVHKKVFSGFASFPEGNFFFFKWRNNDRKKRLSKKKTDTKQDVRFQAKLLPDR
jgi:hypothetical protein